MALIIAYTVIGLTILWATSTIRFVSYQSYVVDWPLLFLFMFPVVAIAVDVAMAALRFEKRRSLAYKRIFSPNRIAHMVSGMALMMTMMLFQGTFTSIKNAMYAWRGSFLYDQVLADVDKFLHFGIDPWHLVSKLLTNPLFHSISVFGYTFIWFVICFGSLFFLATSPLADRVRFRYFASFMMVWILVGNVLAMIFISAGPVFYGAVTGDNARFAEQVALINMLPGSGEFQAYLWELHLNGGANLGSGISAFPSIHVGLITLNSLFAFEIDRRLGVMMSAFTFFILACSVALGWHYAVDGYASIAIVGLIYLAMKKLSGKPRSRSAEAVSFGVQDGESRKALTAS